MKTEVVSFPVGIIVTSISFQGFIIMSYTPVSVPFIPTIGPFPPFLNDLSARN